MARSVEVGGRTSCCIVRPFHARLGGRPASVTPWRLCAKAGGHWRAPAPTHDSNRAMHTAIAKSTATVKAVPLAPAFRSPCVTRIIWFSLLRSQNASGCLPNNNLASVFRAQRTDAVTQEQCAQVTRSYQMILAHRAYVVGFPALLAAVFAATIISRSCCVDSCLPIIFEP